MANQNTSATGATGSAATKAGSPISAATGATGSAKAHHKKENIFQHAKDIIMHILHSFNANTVTNAAIIAKGLHIADMFNKSGVAEELETDAKAFLSSLLTGQNVLNLTDAEIQDTITKAESLASDLHKTQKQ